MSDEAGSDPPWARLAPKPRPQSEPFRGVSAEAWGAELGLALGGALRPRLERLWQEVPGQPRCIEELFEGLACSAVFRDLWAGEDARGPCVVPAPCVRDVLTLEEVLQGLSQVPKVCERALTLTDGQNFRCPIGLPPIGSREQLLEVLRYGTVFLNTASLHWKPLAEICLAANRAFQFPSNVNVYVTGQERAVSTDVHTDNHDVLVLQSQGAKRWRIFSPPLPKTSIGEAAHPLYRGKDEDRLLDSELGDVLLDVVLQPGQALFVPMGFPHATSTTSTGADVSVHLTLGLSTADYDFCLGGLRRALLSELGQPCPEVALGSALWWRLLAPMPVAALAPQGNVWSFRQHLIARLRATCLADAAEVAEEVLQHVVERQLLRQVAVMESQEEAYAEVASVTSGAFCDLGAEKTRSEYRRTMVQHQLAEDARKRRVDVTDERFVKRLSADGTARSLAELRKEHGAKAEDSCLESDLLGLDQS
ncbi:unnamed protein product [Effrenium voratum]|nr:unnamed protein product [Effrenium voratum]